MHLPGGRTRRSAKLRHRQWHRSLLSSMRKQWRTSPPCASGGRRRHARGARPSPRRTTPTRSISAPAARKPTLADLRRRASSSRDSGRRAPPRHVPRAPPLARLAAGGTAGGPAGGFGAIIPPWLGTKSQAVTVAIGACVDCEPEL